MQGWRQTSKFEERIDKGNIDLSWKEAYISNDAEKEKFLDEIAAPMDLLMDLFSLIDKGGAETLNSSDRGTRIYISEGGKTKDNKFPSVELKKKEVYSWDDGTTRVEFKILGYKKGLVKLSFYTNNEGISKKFFEFIQKEHMEKVVQSFNDKTMKSWEHYLPCKATSEATKIFISAVNQVKPFDWQIQQRIMTILSDKSIEELFKVPADNNTPIIDTIPEVSKYSGIIDEKENTDTDTKSHWDYK